MKKLQILLALAVMASMVLAACLPSTPAPTLSEEEQVALIANAVDKAVQTAMAPTVTPTPQGSWGTQAVTPTVTLAPTETVVPSSTPAPTFTPTPLGTETAQAGVTAAALSCITTAEAQEILGLDVQRLEEEPCAWVARNPLQTGFVVKAPEGWELTVTVKEAAEKFVVYIFYGEGGLTLDNVTAVTARKLSGYNSDDAVHVPCLLLAKEQAFGAKEVNSFPVFAGNFTCGV